MKAKLLLSVFLLFSLFTFAKHVPIEQAKKIGKNYFYERVNQIKSLAYDEISLTFLTSDKENNPSYYIFNVSNNKGFIIVSADNEAAPVLGYSFERPFSLEKMAPPLATFLNGYSKQIDEIRAYNIVATPEIKKQWSELNYSGSPKSVKDIMTVDALIQTTWDQSPPYNDLCPVDANAISGYNGRVPVGCVAVAMAQVMKFYNYPLNGTSSYTHPSFANGGYGNMTVNFAAQTYNWYQMAYSAANSSNTSEISKLMYHIGVAVRMGWGPDGSGSQTANIVTALKNYYKYSTTCSIVSKTSYTDATWKALIISQLDLGRPLCHSGFPPSGAGHAWNCDGYQGTTGTETFHMNWGWGGYNNGFFLLTDLYAPASPGQPASSLMEGQQLVINIYPASGYPEYCTSAKTYIGDEGNFNDGSGNQNYQDNQNCTYLIQPSCGKFINLQFDKFDVDPSDVIYIYDGTTTSSPLLATINGGDVPGMYGSTGSAMLINFVTNGSSNKTGWDASYTVDYCKSGILLTQATGSLDDGSGTCNYMDLSNCNWTVDIPSATSITFNFTAFNLAAGSLGDYVSIYKTDMSASNLVQKFTSAAVPTAPVVVNAQKAVIRFASNTSLNEQGWAMDYTSVLSGVNIVDKIVSAVYVYPNPFTNDAQINFDLASNSNLNFSITNVLGQVLYSYEKYSFAGNYNYSLKTLVPAITEGIYFINLKTDKNTIVKKIICTK